MKIFYTDHFVLPLPEGHTFPIEKYSLLRQRVAEAGLGQRDRLVLEYCRVAGLPVAVTMAGGYSRRVVDTVDIHFQTVMTAVEIQQAIQASVKPERNREGKVRI